MSNELPQMVTELYDMSKQYVMQETVEPAKLLADRAKYGLGAGVLFAIGFWLIAMGVRDVLVDALGPGPIGQQVGLLLAVVAIIAFIGIVGWRLSKLSPVEPVSDPDGEVEAA